MDTERLLRTVLDLPSPWQIDDVELDDEGQRVNVKVSFSKSRGPCPKCTEEGPRHDVRKRSWRHLDLGEYQTWIECEVPRVKCPEHGTLQVDVPWADGWARFTARFECVVIDWLREASVSAVARNLRLSWDQIYGIQERAVKRGMERREAFDIEHIGVDETSFQKRHEYVTIVVDRARGQVLYVADGRRQASLDPFFEGLSTEQLSKIKTVAMDMHDPFINSAAWHIPDIESKLCFDRFHVAQMFNRAVDVVRRADNKRLVSDGDDSLKKTKYLWLKNPSSLPRKLRLQLTAFRETALQVAQAWAVKDAASKLWHYKSRTWARKAWYALCDWADSTGLAPLVAVAKTIRYHMLGIVNAIIHKASNAASESINSRVQAIKRRANGYRNRARFRDAILFHLGGLDLYPRPSLHTKP
jgi:transposase